MKAAVIGILGITAAALALPASAQNMQGFYAGASIGQSKFGSFCDDSAGFSCDDKDTAWKIFGGYQFHPNIAVELGYTDLGKATFSGTVLGVAVDGKGEATAFELVGVGSWPLANNFSIYGKLGVYHGEAKVTASGGGFTDSGSDSGSDLTFGFGGRYDFAPNVGARAEWQRYNDFSGSDIDVLSIGILYRFR